VDNLSEMASVGGTSKCEISEGKRWELKERGGKTASYRERGGKVTGGSNWYIWDDGVGMRGN
jgi:hypothetical protein